MIDRNFCLNLAQKSSDINEYIMSLYNMPVQMNAKTIVEIGSGVSTFALVAAANKTGGHVISIDIGGWDTLNRLENGEETMKKEENFTMITGSSMDIEWDTNKQIDFFFLDSEHTYELTMNEMNKWFGYVRHGGIIVMHDTAHENGQQVECRKALNEFLDGKDALYRVIHLLDSKIIGMSVLVKI